MKSFDPFLSHLEMIHDPRRGEGTLYQLPHVLLFSIMAIVTGANSYRGIRTFIKTHLKRLNKAFNIHWKRAPAIRRSVIFCRGSIRRMSRRSFASTPQTSTAAK